MPPVLKQASRGVYCASCTLARQLAYKWSILIIWGLIIMDYERIFETWPTHHGMGWTAFVHLMMCTPCACHKPVVANIEHSWFHNFWYFTSFHGRAYLQLLERVYFWMYSCILWIKSFSQLSSDVMPSKSYSVRLSLRSHSIDDAANVWCWLNVKIPTLLKTKPCVHGALDSWSSHKNASIMHHIQLAINC